MILPLLVLLNLLPTCPVDGWLTSPYGKRRSPFGGSTSWHRGVDLAAPKGTSIRAMWPGQVIRAHRTKGYGKTVVIQHPHGWITRYAHASKVLVTKGQHVDQGQVIAEVGSTGYSTGNHLHLEMKYNRKRVDPLPWLFCPNV